LLWVTLNFDAMLCPLALVQKPLEGFFDRDDLQWVSRRLQVGINKGEEVSDAYIPADRFHGFYPAAAQPAPVPAPASIPAPAHDSTACHQQIQTAVNRMWDMAAGDAEMQQHLLSQINSLEGKLAAIQASHATGTAHPMATLSTVQDTWGNSLVRKRTIGLDGFPKSKRRKTEQPASAAASQPSEAEAAPFSKVKPSRKKVGPRQQAKAASAQSEQENSSAKANSIPPVAPSAAAGQSGKPPRAVRQPRCGRCHTCTHPSLKKGCLQNKEQKALLAAQHT